MNTLTFSRPNMKLRKLAEHLGLPYNQVLSFDLPAGWSCPMADICKTKANEETGKLERFGPVLCYAAKAEAQYPNVRSMRWRNFRILAGGSSGQMFQQIIADMPYKAKIVRIHSSGDYFNPAYFEAWRMVSNQAKNIQFFGYTKILDYVLADKPDNFRLIYSYGSRDDKRWNATIPTCFIKINPTDYEGTQVICDKDDNEYQDYHEIFAGRSFALNLH